MIYQTSSNNGVAAEINVKNYNKRFASHEFWIRMGENYSTICDATTMLFQSGNMGRIQLEKTAAFA
jgi:hypothetical protein